MNILSLDCEYNQPSRKTIQIGAGVYEVRSGLLVEKFDMFVDPGERINDGMQDGQYNEKLDMVKLTGIRDSDVNGALQIKEAFLALKALHEKHQCFRNPLVWGSGVRNDSQHIYDESQVQEPNFMGFRVLDVKTIYQSMQAFRNTTIRGGLQKSCETVGIGFEGSAHNAFWDAHNTFRLWHHLMKKLTKDK